MDIDFKPPRNAPEKASSANRFPWLLALVLSIATLFGLFFLYPHGTPNVNASLENQAASEAEAPPEKPQIVIRNDEIRQGDTLTSLLGEWLSPQQLLKADQVSRKVFSLSRIAAGRPYRITTNDGQLVEFAYDINNDEQFLLRFSGEEIEPERCLIPYEIETDLVEGTISSSLFEAVEEIGEGPELAIELAGIFAWDIDFIRDIREGDSFRALVEKRFRDGLPAGYGMILAAEFVNQGDSFQGIRYQDGNRPASYYDAEGKNLRKAFLRAPLSFTRISSGFTYKRFHPITKTWKSHPAIDYVAPRGTPIMSVGDGTIIKIGKDRYNGRYIKIRHNSSYETLYLHMNAFARNMKKGKRLTQGQVIGYVGSTGLATGPHLCFRMYKNGSPVNPYRVKVPAAKSVSKENLENFLAQARPLLLRLEKPVQVAQNILPEQPEQTQ